MVYLRRGLNSRHKVIGHRIRAGETEVAKQRQEPSYDQVDHGEGNARGDGSDEGNAFENVEFSISESEHSLQDVNSRWSALHEQVNQPLEKTYQEAIFAFVFASGRVIFLTRRD